MSRRGIIWLFIALALSVRTLPAGVFPERHWESRTPQEAGLDRSKLEAIASYLGGRGMIVRSGYSVFTWGDPAKSQDIASAAKPFYAHFLLKAVELWKLDSLDTKLANYVPGLAKLNPGLGYKDAAVTFRHCANQISCYGVEEKPGTAFDYNDWQMALFWDALFLKVYGASYATVDEIVFRPLLTEAIGCEDSPTMMAFGAEDRPGRIRISPRDHCRFGLLYLRGGRWNEGQLLAPEFVKLATTSALPLSLPRTTSNAAEMLKGQRTMGSRQIPDDQTDHLGSYSWLWWVNGTRDSGERLWPGASKDVYAALGHKHGKRGLAVWPSLEVVMAWNDSILDQKPWRDQQKDPHPLNRAFELLVEAAERR